MTRDVATGPLAGRRILSTRPAGSDRELAQRLEADGATFELRPTIRFESPDDPGPALAAVERLDEYGWVVFTSLRGVDAFVSACAGKLARDPATSPDPTLRHTAARRMSGPSAPRIAVVGPTSARRCRERFGRVELIADSPQAAGLADTLLERGLDPDATTRVLLVRPERTSSTLADALSAAGVAVEQPVFYRTTPTIECATIAGDLADGRYDVALFGSPSAIRFLIEATGATGTARLPSAALVAIGPATAAALREVGLEPAAIAAQPDAAGLHRAVRDLLG